MKPSDKFNLAVVLGAVAFSLTSLGVVSSVIMLGSMLALDPWSKGVLLLAAVAGLGVLGIVLAGKVEKLKFH